MGEYFDGKVKETRGNQVVYFLLDPLAAEVKIGKSREVSSRINDLLVANPRLELIGTIKDSEKRLHNQFKSLRTRREWFSLQEPLTSFLVSTFSENILGCTSLELARKKTSISFTEHRKMFQKQLGACAICKKRELRKDRNGLPIGLDIDYNPQTKHEQSATS